MLGLHSQIIGKILKSCKYQKWSLGIASIWDKASIIIFDWVRYFSLVEEFKKRILSQRIKKFGSWYVEKYAWWEGREESVIFKGFQYWLGNI